MHSIERERVYWTLSTIVMYRIYRLTQLNIILIFKKKRSFYFQHLKKKSRNFFYLYFSFITMYLTIYWRSTYVHTWSIVSLGILTTKYKNGEARKTKLIFFLNTSIKFPSNKQFSVLTVLRYEAKRSNFWSQEGPNHC